MRNKIKIFTPLREIEEILPLVKYGADAFFLGFGANKNIKDVNSLNLRPFNDANFTSRAKLKDALKIINSLNKESYLCLNNDFYTDPEFEAVFKLLENISRLLTGVVVSDFLLMKKIKETYGYLKISASTRAKICNSQSVKFYLNAGADKITLPVCLSMNEIKKIVLLNPKVEFKVFVKNEMCNNINALCGVTHNCFENKEIGPVFCKYPREFISVKKKLKNRLASYLKTLCFDNECGVCSMKTLYNMGISTFKMAGRNIPLEKKIQDLYFISSARKFIKDNKKSFENNVSQLHKKIYGHKCQRNCLYEK
ncbi:MAG: U32 family peptidase [Candidatus Omnitrophota bacterium]